MGQSSLSLKLGVGCRLVADMEGDGAGGGLRIVGNRRTVALCRMPIAVQQFSDTNFIWIRSGYTTITPVANGFIGIGEVTVASSRVTVEDAYSPHGDHVVLSRGVRVEGDSPGFGFLTAVEWEIPGASMDDQWFVPGIWYGSNRNVPPYAIGAPGTRSTQNHIVFREDRLPLPLALHFDEEDGMGFSVAHLDATAETVIADDDDAPLIDERIGFGALGLYNEGRTLAFWFPGTEGETTYPPMWTIGRGNDQSESPVDPFSSTSATARSRGWVHRYHPLRHEFRHHYRLRLDAGRRRDYGEACDTVWREIQREYRPAVMESDLEEVERLSISLLAFMTERKGGAIGIPTWVDCFTGRPGRLQNTFGIGVVARNLEVALFLLKYGIKEANDGYRRQGIEMLDFWAGTSGHGLAHTELDPRTGAWVDAETPDGAAALFLRDETEAHRACLAAWSLEKSAGTDHALWLEWTRSYGDWLLGHQNADGSFYRSYRADGTPMALSKGDCTHVIPFLVELGRSVHVSAFQSAALKAARFLWTKYHRAREFFGGTLDNPTCCDKEGAALAMEAYLVLFEATGAKRWLQAAETAARVCETWTFQWNIPMPSDDPRRFFPAGRTTVGFQLVTTGFSAFDMYMTRHVGDYLRLARYTGRKRYRDVARILLHNTKCTIQRGSEYGYAFPGLQIEHWSMGRGRGYGLNSGWLPWVATSHLLSIEAARAAGKKL